MLFSTIAALAAMSGVAQSKDLDPIEIVGNKFFFKSNGSQFYIKGVAYQSNALANATSADSFTDPLADGDKCKRDIPYLQKLSTNVIRVYALNSSVDHSDCMSQLADAGIYVISDLSEPGLSINRDDPQWNTALFSRYTTVVDNMANYTNVLGFFAGNEVVNAANNTNSAPFVKAAVRDVKAYIKQKNYRQIPVGYSASDDADVRVAEADYFACGKTSEHADFYGVNMYEWCGKSDFEESGYEARTKEMKNMSIPLFFSEYGCNEVQPRKFEEVGTLYSSDMDDVWSGGIVYMYFQEENDYGLVSVSGNSVSTMDDFKYLSSELATVSPSIRKASDQTESTSTIACPATSQKNWAAATSLPPTPDADICDCLSDSSSCVLSDDVDEDDYGKLFGTLCGEMQDTCKAINSNGTSGVYGSFAACSPKQQLSYLINEYYNANGQDKDACDFSGSASLVSDVKTASSCKAYFSAVGTAGTGAISQGTGINPGSTGGAQDSAGGAAATGTATGKTSGSGSKSSGSGSGSSSGSSSSNAAATVGPTQGSVQVIAAVLGGVFGVLALTM